MTYTPTKEELEELGFKENYLDHYYNDITNDVSISFSKGRGFSICIDCGPRGHFYPQSLEDIKTLIKLLTPLTE